MCPIKLSTSDIYLGDLLSRAFECAYFDAMQITTSTAQPRGLIVEQETDDFSTTTAMKIKNKDWHRKLLSYLFCWSEPNTESFRTQDNFITTYHLWNINSTSHINTLTYFSSFPPKSSYTRQFFILRSRLYPGTFFCDALDTRYPRRRPFNLSRSMFEFWASLILSSQYFVFSDK